MTDELMVRGSRGFRGTRSSAHPRDEGGAAGAERLLPPGRCIECEVEKAAVAGAVAGGSGGRFLFLDGVGLVVRYARVPRRLGGRSRAWLVTSVARRRRASR